MLAGAGVLLGAWWAAGSEVASAADVRRAAFAALSAGALTVAANAWNDVADVDIDRRAHPARPLPSGCITLHAARRLASVCAVLGVALAAASDPALGAVSAAAAVLMYAYSPWIKRTGLAGNVCVAVLASLPFLYGAWAVGHPRSGLALVGIAIPLHLAREIAKDIEDASADAPVRRTMPVVAGAPAALAVLGAACLAFLISLLPFVRLRPSFGVAALPAAALVAYAAAAAMRGRRGSPAALKLAMVCAMVALVIARP